MRHENVGGKGIGHAGQVAYDVDVVLERGDAGLAHYPSRVSHVGPRAEQDVGLEGQRQLQHGPAAAQCRGEDAELVVAAHGGLHVHIGHAVGLQQAFEHILGFNHHLHLQPVGLQLPDGVLEEVVLGGMPYADENLLYHIYIKV